MEESSFEEVKKAAQKALEEMVNETDDEWFLSRLRFVSNSLIDLQDFYEELLRANGRALEEKEEFELRFAQLAGLHEQFTALGRKRPESTCGTFKAQQVNRVLVPLKALLENDLGFELSLVSEEDGQTYSDVSLLIRGYMDLCSSFASRRYGMKYDERGREIPSRKYGYGHR